MSTQRYSVSPHPIDTLLTWVKSGETAIPELQRPFVWEATKVRNLLDSPYQGYPIAYLIAWRNPTVPLSLLDGEVPEYDAFLAERRTLMAKKIRDWFEVL